MVCVPKPISRGEGEGLMGSISFSSIAVGQVLVARRWSCIKISRWAFGKNAIHSRNIQGSRREPWQLLMPTDDALIALSAGVAPSLPEPALCDPRLRCARRTRSQLA